MDIIYIYIYMFSHVMTCHVMQLLCHAMSCNILKVFPLCFKCLHAWGKVE